MSDLPPIGGDDAHADSAGEYVLGLGDEHERNRARARLSSDHGFRAEVDAWEQRLAPLLDGVAPRQPPARVWDAIASSTAPGSNVLRYPGRPRAWDRPGPWRAATAVLALAAAALVVVVMRPSRPTAPAAAPPTILAATLKTPDGKPLFVATLDRARGGVTLVPVGAMEAHGRFPELWIIPAGGKPQAVGMIDAGRPGTIGAGSPALAAAAPQAVFAVSMEPAGGSPTGAPTGPVIATGPVNRL